MDSGKKTLLLDVDPSIIENNLLLTSNDGELQSLFPSENDAPYKLVTPSPGLCVKLRQRQGGEKVFVNVCHTKDIPAPEDITEERLSELLQDDSATCNHRIPLSIGERRQEPDKSGVPASVFDVAINSTFFAKVESSQTFRLFLIYVILQGVEEKFSVELEADGYVILKNRRNMGSLPAHRIRTRDRKDPAKPREPLVQELGTAGTTSTSTSVSSSTPTASAPAPLQSQQPPREKPDFRLLKECKALVAQFRLPNVVSAAEVNLDVGEDRVVLEATSHNYYTDFFLPEIVKQNWTTAKFDLDTKVLTVTMPLAKAC